ncbi:hypothetical protein B9Z55_018667 [Caenorhabditis nigoni]|uniref:Copper transport protein n=1 Tax=Caenorhabditis nigoni TaxID=1611254 RepID=A0A2G5TF06_9PELO|nr:hypothetical protein B9Z55_018667 [Caenorhabditis nigoni]
MDHSHHHHAHKGTIGNTAVANTQSSDHMMMHHAMSFHFGTEETILFDFWKTETAVEIAVSCFITVLLAFLMETIRFFRDYRKAQIQIHQPPIAPEDRLKRSPQLDLIDPLLQLFQLTIAYCLMLIFMTFNVYLCFFTVVGEIISHLLYRTLYPHLNSSSAGHC